MMHPVKSLLKITLIVFIYVSSIQNLYAEKSIVVQALFSGKAVLMIDGQRRILAIGETSPEGVKLLKADSRQATIEIDGASKDYLLGSSVSYNFKKQENIEEQVYSDDQGMFLSIGTINGQTVRFLIDTGATTIAMNTSQAKKLGIRYRIDGKPMRVSTASSFVDAYSIKLKTVSLGKIKLRNIEAVVIDGKHPGPILLGMSFLNKLRVEKAGNILKIKQKK